MSQYQVLPNQEEQLTSNDNDHSNEHYTDNEDDGIDLSITEETNPKNYQPIITKESWNYPRKNIGKTFAIFLSMIVFGMHDASVGVLVKSVSIYISNTNKSYTYIYT